MYDALFNHLRAVKLFLISYLPGAQIPTTPDNFEWDKNNWVEMDDSTVKGDTEESVSGNGGWAYYNGDGEAWVETGVADTSGDSVHSW